MKKLITPVRIFAITAYLFASCFPAFAQSDEEKKFLLMYFTEEELVVQSATRSPKPVSQVAENITVVTAKEIELMNAHTVADVLNTVTGVEIWFNGGPGQIAQGYIQGSEARHVTVVIDGVVLNNLGENTVDLGMMPVQNIEKIEIIKGPASSTWGSALGGVVNIVTKSGSIDRLGGMLSASYGTKNSGDFRAEARGRQDRFGYYFNAGRLQTDGLTPHFNVSEHNGYAKLNYDVSNRTGILFTLGYAKTSRGQGFDPFTSYDNSLQTTYSMLAVNSALNKEVDLNISIRTIRQDFINNYYDLSTGVASEDRYKDKGYGSSAKLTWKNAMQAIVLGADFDDKTLKSAAIAGGEQGIKKWAVFANDTVTFNKLAITPGIRFDHTNTNGDMTSPSLGVAYSIANSTILRAYTAKGFSIPTLGQTFGDNVFYIANPDLKVETVWSYQAGVETAAVKYIWMKLSAFRNEIRDALSPESTGPNPSDPFTYVNKGKQRRQGIEIAVKTAPVYNISISAGAEYIDAKNLETSERLKDVPTHVYDIGIRYDDEQSFKALLHGRYINWNADPLNLGEYGSFIFDLNVIKKIYHREDSSLEAFVDVHNIFNDSQYLIDVFKNPGRWYEGGIRYKF